MLQSTQLHEIILNAFATKGYALQTPISRKQLIKVITILVKQRNNHLSQQPIDQAILNQIWKQTQNRIQQEEPDRKLQSIVLQDVIQSFIDAIEILSNRITQCTNTAEQMTIKRKQLEKEKDFAKAQMLHHKIVTLRTDLKQFQKDLVSLTYPFNQNVSELTKKLSIRKNSGQKTSPIVSKKSLEIDIPFLELQKKPSIMHKGVSQQLQQYMRQNPTNPYLDAQTVDDAKHITLWILALFMCLQCTVMLVKYSFINLMVFLLGFFVLLQQFRPAMARISFYSCLFSLLIDVLWLLVNSIFYINPQINTGLTLFNKKYQLYIWFLTLVQVFIKIIYLILFHRFQFLETVFSQQLQKDLSNPPQQQYSFQSKNRQLVDHYIPDMKQLLKIEKVAEEIKN